MWFLTGPEGELIYLKPNSEIVVGRTRGDIILRDDKSVSRNHASVTIRSTNDDSKSWCFVKDLDSKYGSSILRGGEKIKITKEGIGVHHNDKVKFGLQNNDYIVSHIPIRVLVSSMNDTEYLQSIVKDLDGCIVHEWTKNVTHLTTPRAKLGEKIALALVNCIPIVGIEYWEAAKDAVENNREWPKFTEYILPISEDMIDNTKVSLKPNPDRKSLFSNLTFLFFSFSQLKIYKAIIKGAGGEVLMFDAPTHTDLTQFCSDKFVTVYYMIGTDQTEESILDSQGLIAGYEKIEEILHEKKCRMISDSEITLAILQCSLKQHCNPKHDYKKLLLEHGKNVPDRSKKASVVALDTQDLRPKSTSSHISGNIIAETNEFMSQGHGKSQEDTQFSGISSNIESRASSPGRSDISSIYNNTQESTCDVETNFESLNIDGKRSEKRGPEPLISVPAKKSKLVAGSSLFPVLPKKKSQDRFSQSLQGSQGSKSFRSSQLSDRSDVSVSLSQHIRPTTSQTRELRINEKEVNEEISRQTEKNIVYDKRVEEIEPPAEKSKQKNECSRYQLDLEARSKISKADESVIWCEPEAKKKKMSVRDDSSSKVFKILTERNDKRKRSDGDGDSDSNNVEVQTKQRKMIDSFRTTPTESLVKSIDDENEGCMFVTGLIRPQYRDSLLERSFGHKTFNKVYKTIPTRRVKLDSMIIWGTENDENAE